MKDAMPPEEVLQPECYKRHAEIENHINEGKGWRIAIGGIIITVLMQVGAFLFMWGGLTNTVKKNSEYIWGELTASTKENTRSLDKLMARLEGIKIIAVTGEQGVQGVQGIQGVQGKDGMLK